MIDTVFAALAAAPDLPGAACRGLAPGFDAARPDETVAEVAHRHLAALAICAKCPALAACSSWLETLPVRERPVGVVAGRITQGATTKTASRKRAC